MAQAKRKTVSVSELVDIIGQERMILTNKIRAESFWAGPGGPNADPCSKRLFWFVCRVHL